MRDPPLWVFLTPSLTAEIFLIWTNVAKIYVAWTNVTVTAA